MISSDNRDVKKIEGVWKVFNLAGNHYIGWLLIQESDNYKYL